MIQNNSPGSWTDEEYIQHVKACGLKISPQAVENIKKREAARLKVNHQA